VSGLLCLAMHAEELERDDVWRAVSRFAGAFERRGMRLTVFVHPFRAIRSGFDLAPRLGELRDRGHEIGQHTHYYATFEETAAGTRKETRLDRATIRACLDRDHAYLRDAGAAPSGYVSGGWAIHDEIFAWLRERGFVYDCSYRTYRLPYANAAAIAGDAAAGPFRLGGLVEVPTTDPMSGWMRRGGSWRRATARAAYRLVYLHDTDLLRGATGRIVSALAPELARGSRSVTGSALATIVSRDMKDRRDG
jgi:hypothetical protein